MYARRGAAGATRCFRRRPQQSRPRDARLDPDVPRRCVADCGRGATPLNSAAASWRVRGSSAGGRVLDARICWPDVPLRDTRGCTLRATPAAPAGSSATSWRWAPARRARHGRSGATSGRPRSARVPVQAAAGRPARTARRATAAGTVARPRARDEIEVLTRELSAAYRLAASAGGRPGRAVAAVTNQIRHPRASGRRPRSACTSKGLRGVFCSYTAERPVSWQL